MQNQDKQPTSTGKKVKFASKTDLDLYPEIEHETTVQTLDVSESEKSDELRYTVLLQDKRNMQAPVALDIYFTHDGHLLHCDQVDLDDIVDTYEEVQAVYQPTDAT